MIRFDEILFGDNFPTVYFLKSCFNLITLRHILDKKENCKHEKFHWTMTHLNASMCTVQYAAHPLDDRPAPAQHGARRACTVRPIHWLTDSHWRNETNSCWSPSFSHCSVAAAVDTGHCSVCLSPIQHNGLKSKHFYFSYNTREFLLSLLMHSLIVKNVILHTVKCKCQLNHCSLLRL